MVIKCRLGRVTSNFWPGLVNTNSGPGQGFTTDKYYNREACCNNCCAVINISVYFI